MITQLRLSGVFENVRGVIIGQFIQKVKGKLFDQRVEVTKLIKEAMPDVPIVSNAPYGHVKDCWTIPLGAWATLDADNGTFKVEPRQ